MDAFAPSPQSITTDVVPASVPASLPVTVTDSPSLVLEYEAINPGAEKASPGWITLTSASASESTPGVPESVAVIRYGDGAGFW